MVDDRHGRLLVFGGRDYADRAVVRALVGALDPGCTLVHGSAEGADRMAATFAVGRGMKVDPYPADWHRHGRVAGPIRNREMARSGLDVAFALPGGRGTKSMAREAARAGVPIFALIVPP